jgi:uncharacterized protein with HEPN domain
VGDSHAGALSREGRAFALARCRRHRQRSPACYEKTAPEIVWAVVKLRLAPLEKAITIMLSRLNDQS